MMTRSFTAIAAYLLPVCLWAQSGLKISEVSTVNPSWIEIINLGSSPVNLNGYKIRWGGNSGISFLQGVYTIPSVVLNPSAVLVITEDFSTAQPAVPAGVFKAYCGGTIPWNVTPGVGVNGCVALNDPLDLGLDRMKWGNPLQDFSIYGSPWSSAIVPTSSTMFRNSPVDTDAPADWTSTATPTPGAVNPGEANVISFSLTTTPGTGSITATVQTFAPPVPFGDVYNLVSFYDLTPDGSGPLFGIGADALLQATYGPPFHISLDANGNWTLSGGPGTLPLGTHLEGVSLLVQGGAITRIAKVTVVTL
jgi:hypothetical protein